MKRERKILPFTNKFGDTINPGEQVYVITTCTHTTCVNKGEYLGFVEREDYDWKLKQTKMMPYVQVKVKDQRTVWFDTLKNEKYSWVGHNNEYFQAHVEHRKEDFHRISTLYYNNVIPANASADRLMAAV